MKLPGILSNPSQTLRQWEDSLVKWQEQTSPWIDQHFPSLKTVSYNLKVCSEDYAIKRAVKLVLFSLGFLFLKAIHFCRSLTSRATPTDSQKPVPKPPTRPTQKKKKREEPDYHKVPRNIPLTQSFEAISSQSSPSEESSNGSHEIVERKQSERPHTKRGRRNALKRQREAKASQT